MFRRFEDVDLNVGGGNAEDLADAFKQQVDQLLLGFGCSNLTYAKEIA